MVNMAKMPIPPVLRGYLFLLNNKNEVRNTVAKFTAWQIQI